MAIQLEKYQAVLFFAKQKNGDFKHLRLGQAFFNHFRLDKMSQNQNPEFCKLYEADGDDAKRLIEKLFTFN